MYFLNDRKIYKHAKKTSYHNCVFNSNKGDFFCKMSPFLISAIIETHTDNKLSTCYENYTEILEDVEIGYRNRKI